MQKNHGGLKPVQRDIRSGSTLIYRCTETGKILFKVKVETRGPRKKTKRHKVISHIAENVTIERG